MLFLAQALLRAAGFEYDEIDETWRPRLPLRPLAAVECDEDRDYIREALREVRVILDGLGCRYNNFVVAPCAEPTDPRLRSRRDVGARQD